MHDRLALPIDVLRSALSCRVVTPSDSDYNRMRTVMMGGIDRRPSAIVCPLTVEDIAHTIAFARQHGAELAVRSGGHSSAGHSVTDGGIVIDLRELKALDVDVAGRTAWAQAGLTAGEVTEALAEHGLAVGFGDTGTVGIGGITLGGGVGFLVRKFGLTIDSLLAAEIVTADGRVIEADATNHPDLFWALRGGGGNFGVVTRFKFQLRELPSFYGGMLILPATPEVVAGFMAEAEAAPEEFSAIANVMPAPPMPFLPAELHGKMIVMGLVAYAGDVAKGKEVVDRFRALAEPLADMVKPMSYGGMFGPEDPDYRPTAVSRIMYLDGFGKQQAQTALDALAASDAPLRVVQLRVLGGAVARVSPDATAYVHRTQKIMAAVASFYVGPDDKPRREAWVKDLSAALGPVPGAYVNFLGDEGEERVRAAYPGATWDRLAKVKAQYDPDNVFRLNQNIPPAT
ncbi:FAD-binding oxidoreductase [Devosia nitrariae]|uniref:FAD-linked oxidase n=1 Tax=Devosia nitrariae TaxID=2071872 RepID=A0ABQ5W533_9HYPH|nr:FAD-binding oxidoreductase [Devosia nitrariae]GLQ54899.1 FAD-linked oxidase [Devosia nitrariae]